MTTHNTRYVARIVLEAITPLALGNGQANLLTTAMVARDFNGLPYIPATSLAGVLRAAFAKDKSEKEIMQLFGDEIEEEKEGEKESVKAGSRIMLSDALLVGSEGKVMQTLVPQDQWEPYYHHFLELPVREHVRISHTGAMDAGEMGKFDQEVVYRGSRFKFEMELLGTADDEATWKFLLRYMTSPDFLLGAGITNGFGQLQPIASGIYHRKYNLKAKDDLEKYLNLSANLNPPLAGGVVFNEKEKEGNWTKPPPIMLSGEQALFHFGTGYGDEETDAVNNKERKVEWTGNTPRLSDEEYFVIPGTSVKGAIAHRVAYYYNQQEGHFIEIKTNNKQATALDMIEKGIQERISEERKKLGIDTVEDINEKIEKLKALAQSLEDLKNYKPKPDASGHEENADIDITVWTGENNPAVAHLFGTAKDDKMGEKHEDEEKGAMGKVIIRDIYIPVNEDTDEIIFDHNAIDRFTGGTMDGALYSEKAFKVPEIKIQWWEHTSMEEAYRKILRQAINDIKNGSLPLGGKTTKGHGIISTKYVP